MNKPGIYIHIPFCSGKCFYCDFYSAPGEKDIMDAYTDALCRHIREFSGVEADTVYFGGGTPSLIGAENLIKILSAVKESFILSDDPQITLEANPGDICVSANVRGNELTALNMLRSVGFDRISFGIQASQNDVLKKLGRRHDFETAEQAVAYAKAAGFEDISLDLMYGLPDQTLAEWKNSILSIMRLEPTHISCYSLKLDKNVPLYAAIDRIPEDELQYEMYLLLVDMLKNHGYEQYEISNFAKKGFFSRHNMKYWTGADYYGFGPSAHSFVNSARYAYSNDTLAYIAGKWEKNEYCIMTADDALEEYVMLGLRTVEGISTKELSERFGLNTVPLADLFQKYSKHGLARIDNDRLSLTPKGFFVSNAIIVEALELLQ